MWVDYIPKPPGFALRFTYPRVNGGTTALPTCGDAPPHMPFTYEAESNYSDGIRSYLQLSLKRFALHWSHISVAFGFSVVDSYSDLGQ